MKVLKMLSSTSYLKNILRGVLVCLLRPIERLAPRSKGKWLFGSINGTFKDNPKYLYYWTIENHPEIRPIWIGRKKDEIKKLKSKGFEAYYWLSLKGLFHALTSKVYICDHQLGDINIYLSGGAFYVNLWHGASVKRVKWQAPSYYMRYYNLRDEGEMRTSLCFKLSEYADLFVVPDFCLAPSEIHAREFFAPMMDIPLSKCVVGVYPRSRLLLGSRKDAMTFIEKYESISSLNMVKELQKYSKVYIYMPTWRNDDRDFITQSGILWQELSDIMKDRNELFVVKLHPFTKINIDNLSHFRNILLFPSACDIYTILPFVDCLITDYSSIYTDFLMMNKEIILFVFDYQEYIVSNYDLSDYDKYFIGKKVYDFKQLLQVLISGEDCRIPQVKYDFLMDFFWNQNQNKVDIVEAIKNKLENIPA